MALSLLDYHYVMNLYCNTILQLIMWKFNSLIVSGGLHLEKQTCVHRVANLIPGYVFNCIIDIAEVFLSNLPLHQLPLWRSTVAEQSL